MPARVISYNERHLLPDSKAVAIFNHIPKCGGTTLSKMLAACFPGNCVLATYNIFDMQHRLNTADSFISHDVSGIEHLLPDETNCYYFTFLRHPLARMISLIYFLKYYLFSNVISNSFFEQLIYTHSPKNTLIQFLGNGNKELAAENLFEKYTFFGLVEAYTTSINALSDIIPKLRLQKIVAYNVSEKHAEIDSKARDYFFETNRDDIELYEMALKEFKQRYAAPCEPENFKQKTLQSKSVNKKDARLAYLKNLSDIVLNTDVRESTLQLSEMNADIICNTLNFDSQNRQFQFTTNDLFVLCESFNDSKLLYRCLMRGIDTYDSFVYFTFKCTQKIQLRKPMRESAERLFELCRRIDPGNNLRVLVECRLDIVQSIVRDGLWKTADPLCVELEDWLRLLQAQCAWCDRSLHMLGSIRMAEDNWDEAVSLLREAAALKPQDLEIHEALCKALLQSGPEGLATAMADARTALSVNPGTEWALRQMAVCAERTGASTEAVHFARLAVTKNPCYGKGWSILAHAALKDDTPEYALEHARAAVDAAPENAEYSYFLCGLLHSLGSDDEALAAIDNTLRSWPGRGRLHLLAAEILEGQGRPEQALERMRLAVDADPEAVELRVRFGQMLMRLGKADEVESLACEARDRSRSCGSDPHCKCGSLSSAVGWPFVYLALVAEGRNDIEEALAQMRKACETQPEKRSFAAQYARLLRVAGRLDEAETFCRHALEKDPNQAWAWRELCRCAGVRGDSESARELGQRALEAQPDDAEFQRYLAALPA